MEPATISVPAPAAGTPDQAAARIARLLPLGLCALAILLLIPRIVLFAQVTTRFVTWPWQFDYTEGVNLNATLTLAAGHNIYQHNGPDSFISTPYTPLFYVLNAPITWLTGPSLGFGRALSLLATLLVAGLLVYAITRATGRPLAGALAGMLWLGLAPVIVWAALYTQHILALMFGLAGLVWAAYNPTGRRLWVAAGLLALAFYTKQSAVDAAAAVTLWLFIHDRRTGLRFGIALATLIAAPFLLANLLLKGGLWEHTLSNQALGWNERRFMRLLGRLWGEYWPILGWGLACLAATVAALLPGPLKRWRSWLTAPWGLAVLYFVIAQASVLVRLGRDGVNYNHMIDALLPACLLAGLAVGHLWRWADGIPNGEGRHGHLPLRTTAGAAAGGVLLLLMAQTLLLSDPHTWYKGAWPDAQVDARYTSLARIVAETPGDIYSEDESLLLMNGHSVIYDDPFMFTNLASQGRWNESGFTRSIRDRRFGLVVLEVGSTRWTDAGQAAFNDNYQIKFADMLTMYVPKLVPNTPATSLSCSLQGEQDSIALEGYSLAPGVAWNGIKRGETLRVTLYWKAGAPLAYDYASYVHVLNDKQETVAAQDNPQTGAAQPPTAWQPGESVTDMASLPIPPGTPPGTYRLIAGLYTADRSGIHGLAASCRQGEEFGDAVLLGTVQVK